MSPDIARLGAFDAQDVPSMDGLRACVHCGICLPQCPTYRVLGEEMDSPRGRVYLMRAAAEDRIGLTPTMARHLDLCLGCRACETACPSGVPFGPASMSTRRFPKVFCLTSKARILRGTERDSTTYRMDSSGEKARPFRWLMPSATTVSLPSQR